MIQTERLDEILKIITRYKYVTVKFLTEELHYSTATINRDLNILAEQKLITRHYGGAEIVESNGVPLKFRYHKMHASKNRIARKAAELVSDGDTIFMDASTTSQCMMQYLTEKKNITVISNNMALVAGLSEYGIRAICLGGEVLEAPSMLYSSSTVELAKTFKANKHFFSSGGVTSDGKVLGGESYGALCTVMRDNSDKSYFLVDSDKLKFPRGIKIHTDFDEIDAVISDFDFPEKTKEKFKNTEFIVV